MAEPTGAGLKATKAIWAGALAFLAPGAAYLIGVSGNGVSGNEWLVAALTSVVAGGVTGGIVYQVENKPKV